MSALIAAVLAASLVGSLHCAGMCGPFVAFIVGTERHGAARHSAIQAAYHGGRLLSYVSLGAIAGALGAALDLGGTFLGLQRAALMVAGGLMILFGLVALAEWRGLRVGSLRPPTWLQALFRRAHRMALGRAPVLRALLVGLFSTLLPCGWLYAFVVAAAGTGSVLSGAVAMGAFWLGTVPILAGLGVGVRGLAGPLKRYVPVATALALMLVGVMSITGRFNVPALAATQGSAAGDSGPESTLDQIEHIDSSELPCCDGEGE